MTKKKKKLPPLDDAARARIAERRNRKAARKTEREQERERYRLEKAAAEARRNDPALIAERTERNREILANDAWIVVDVDGKAIAGLLPPDTAGTVLLIREDGREEDEEPFDLPEDALIWLYSQAYGPLHPELLVEHVQARIRGEPEPAHVIPRVNIITRTGDSKSWLNEMHAVLIAKFRNGTLDEFDYGLFYEFVADEPTRREMDARPSIFGV